MKITPDIPTALPVTVKSQNKSTDPEAIKKVAKDMEALFAYEMIKAMRATTKESAVGGLGNDTYMSMFDMELSKIFAERGMGLQDMLVKGLTATSGLVKTSEPQTLSEEIKTILPGDQRLRISSDFGLRQDPFTGDKKFHHGLDLPAPEGAEVHPVHKGTVLFSGQQGGYGNVVIVDHGDGFVSKYAHNEANLVNAGDAVDPATVIATVGSTGRSTGPHVHFEVLYRGEKVDPRTLLAQADGQRKG